VVSSSRSVGADKSSNEAVHAKPYKNSMFTVIQAVLAFAVMAFTVCNGLSLVCLCQGLIATGVRQSATS
jgi:hypothetical protein